MKWSGEYDEGEEDGYAVGGRQERGKRWEGGARLEVGEEWGQEDMGGGGEGQVRREVDEECVGREDIGGEGGGEVRRGIDEEGGAWLGVGWMRRVGLG